MKFTYTALTADNKKINGVFDLPDRESVESELHRMGVAIISVTPISDEEYAKFQADQEALKESKGIRTFGFLGVDQTGKDVEGTIDAMDEFTAFLRLTEEYSFKIGNLFPAGASEDERKRALALVPGLEAQLAKYRAEDKKGGAGRKKREEEGEGEENREIIEEIDRVVVQAKRTIEQESDLFSLDLMMEIQNTLGELERIRTSNNIKHITSVANDLYTLLSHPDKIDPDSDKARDYEARLGEIRESALVQNQYELYAKAIDATGLRRVFGDIKKRLAEVVKPKEAEDGKAKGFLAKWRQKIHESMTKSFKRKPIVNGKLAKPSKPKSKWVLLKERLSAYLTASSPVLKKARQRELRNTIRSFFGKKQETAPVANAPRQEIAAVDQGKKRKEPGHGGKWVGFFLEADSFVGWLLCFYVLYFFLVGFSIEKGVGLDREFVFKTFRTPLLVNITLLLLMVHWVLRFTNRNLRSNRLAALFLLFLVAGVYMLAIINF